LSHPDVATVHFGTGALARHYDSDHSKGHYLNNRHLKKIKTLLHYNSSIFVAFLTHKISFSNALLRQAGERERDLLPSRGSEFNRESAFKKLIFWITRGSIFLVKIHQN
jgi:hypothetical protein